MQASLLLQRHCLAAEHFGQPGLQYRGRSGGGQLQSILFHPLHRGGDTSLQWWPDKVFSLCISRIIDQLQQNLYMQKDGTICIFFGYIHCIIHVHLHNPRLSMLFQWPSFLCRCGDILLEVNGKSTWGMTHTALVRLLKELRGRITLTIVSWPGSLL